MGSAVLKSPSFFGRSPRDRPPILAALPRRPSQSQEIHVTGRPARRNDSADLLEAFYFTVMVQWLGPGFQNR